MAFPRRTCLRVWVASHAAASAAVAHADLERWRRCHGRRDRASAGTSTSTDAHRSTGTRSASAGTNTDTGAGRCAKPARASHVSREVVMRRDSAAVSAGKSLGQNWC